MHKQRFKIGSSVTSWKVGHIIFNDFNKRIDYFFYAGAIDETSFALSLYTHRVGLWLALYTGASPASQDGGGGQN